MKYVTRPHSPKALGYFEDEPMIPCITVDGPKEVDSGLLDAYGEPLYRLQPPIGFGRNDEW